MATNGRGAVDGRRGAPVRGLLTRLARDRSGNTLAMMAAFLIPAIGLTGSAIDTARLYLVKTRLQQACDAGVLAGRKFMVDSAATTLDPAATTQANAFFANNFKDGWLATNTTSFAASKTSDNQVAGRASTVVPMTLMKMLPFGIQPITIALTCEARFDIADTDVMFVLDTTGSMACTTADGTAGCSQPIMSYTRPDGTKGYYVEEKSGSKLSGLRAAVMQFYDTVDTTKDPSTNVRYGFVTYTSTVNVGYALPSNSMVGSWTYQSRRVLNDANNGNASSVTNRPVTQAACNSAATGRNPASGYTTSGTATLVTSSWSSINGGTCVVTTQPLKPNWRYEPVTYDVSSYVTGAAVTDPSKVTGETSKWQGCLEERDTVVANSFDVNNLPPDLDPDLVPTSDDTRWRPMWPDVVYYRSTYSTFDYAGNYNAPTAPPAPYVYGDYVYTGTTYATILTSVESPLNAQGGFVSCGKPVQKLAKLSRADVSTYVNAADFRAQGGTYHDVGMIWGTRLISPSGLFAADTAAWPGRNPPNRYIVFMTDGAMAPNQNIYGMYGLETYDKRVSGGNFGSLTDYHNARFQAECSAAKARNITVFVVGFGQTLNQSLTDCASPGQAYFASDNAALTAAFQTIARQIAMLRISK